MNESLFFGFQKFFSSETWVVDEKQSKCLSNRIGFEIFYAKFDRQESRKYGLDLHLDLDIKRDNVWH